ncbi:hypothetical protein JOF53_000900 [Crossiella equi]|uniref:Tetratricopeptide repeat protein n=1 Tax=Crossiella equi TaxID=130796 RepID=A0ABS5A607_9PSEU|nr:tetratricopeptide repeat protein [Crossiella equi]MBP2472028.1 hypothetical protein [Crossiella equi]
MTLTPRRSWWPLWLRWRGWVLLTGCAVLGAAVGLLARSWLAAGLAAAVAAVVGVVLARGTARGKAVLDDRDKAKASLPDRVEITTDRGGLVRVADLRDAVTVRVHPAPVLERPDGSLDREPPYVRRDVDRKLDRLVAGVCFVLLVGESAAGKTRTAYELIKRTLPDHHFLHPRDRTELAPVIGTILEHRRCVVWLDDLDRFLGLGGLSATMVNRILGDGGRHVVIVATMRAAAHAGFGERAEAKAEGGTKEVLRAGRDVLRLANRFDLPRRWTEAELVRARSEPDPRLRRAVAQAGEFGVAEVLAAGPKLLADWHAAWSPGSTPRGAALVAAAVDCSRAGLVSGVPERVLRTLHEPYLTARGGAALRPEDFTAALAWATDPVPETTSSLLLRVNGGYRAFDYLVDTVTEPVPPETWRALLDGATPQQCYDIGLAAYQQGRYEHAETGLSRATGIPLAREALARCVGDAGRPAEAAALLHELAGEQADTCGPHNPRTLATRRLRLVYLGLAEGPLVAAEQLADLAEECVEHLGEDHPETLSAHHEHARATGLGGQHRVAVRQLEPLAARCTEVLGAHHPLTLRVRYLHATELGEAGQLGSATTALAALVRYRTDVLDLADDPETLVARHQHASYLGRAQQHTRAVAAFESVVADRRRVLGARHPDTLTSVHQLGNYLGLSGAARAAADLYADLVVDRLATGGAEHVDTLAARYQHAFYLAEAGEDPQARRELAEVAEDCRRVLGSEHEITAAAETALRRSSVEGRKR